MHVLYLHEAALPSEKLKDHMSGDTNERGDHHHPAESSGPGRVRSVVLGLGPGRPVEHQNNLPTIGRNNVMESLYFNFLLQPMKHLCISINFFSTSVLLFKKYVGACLVCKTRIFCFASHTHTRSTIYLGKLYQKQMLS